MIEVLDGVGHVIADAAYDSNDLRQLIEVELNATAQIKHNPTRILRSAIDWTL